MMSSVVTINGYNTPGTSPPSCGLATWNSVVVVVVLWSCSKKGIPALGGACYNVCSGRFSRVSNVVVNNRLLQCTGHPLSVT
jgi:hypothetical protein